MYTYTCACMWYVFSDIYTLIYRYIYLSSFNPPSPLSLSLFSSLFLSFTQTPRYICTCLMSLCLFVFLRESFLSESWGLYEEVVWSIATHCHTLQDTAAHCNNTLQHTATHCNTLLRICSDALILVMICWYASELSNYIMICWWFFSWWTRWINSLTQLHWFIRW